MSSDTSARIQAGQLIYTNVEEDQSPKKRGGFQTVCYTRDALTELEVQQEIEPRLIYPSRQDRPTIHTFFRLQSGKTVFARMVPNLGTDKLNRPKVLFAHALIFSAASIARMDNNPFLIDPSWQFLKAMEDVPTNRPAGDIAPAEIPLRSSSPKLVLLPTMDRSQAKMLVLLALQAELPAGERLTLGCTGETPRLEQLLQDLFSVAPPALRLHLGFDTMFVGDNGLSKIPQSSYWALGAGRGQSLRQIRMCAFDLEKLRFSATPPIAKRSSMLELWLDLIFQNQDWHERMLAMGTLFEVEQWLTSKEKHAPDPPLDQLGDRDCDDFVRANEGALKRRLENKMGDLLGDDLAHDLVADHWREAMQQPKKGKVQHLRYGLPLARVAEQLNGLVEARPNARALEGVKRFLAKHGTNEKCRDAAASMNLRALRWARNWPALSDALARVDHETFRGFALWVCRNSAITWAKGYGLDSANQLIIGPCLPLGRDDASAQDLFLALLGITLDAPRGKGGAVTCSIKLAERWPRWTSMLERLPPRGEPAAAVTGSVFGDADAEASAGVLHDLRDGDKRRMIESHLISTIGEGLAGRCLQWADRLRPEDLASGKHRVIVGWQEPRLACWIKHALHDQWLPPLDAAESKRLSAFVTQQWDRLPGELLYPLLAIYRCGEKNWEQLDTILPLLSEEEFARFAEWSLNVQPAPVEMGLALQAPDTVLWGPAFPADTVKRGNHRLCLSLLGVTDESKFLRGLSLAFSEWKHERWVVVWKLLARQSAMAPTSQRVVERKS